MEVPMALRMSRPLCDLGLFSDNPSMLEFYEHDLGLPFVEALPHSPTYQERFYSVHGASLKINYSLEPMPPGTSGFRALMLARAGATTHKQYRDPDGLTIVVVPPGADGVRTIGVVLVVPSASQEQAFFRAIGAREDQHGLVLGDTRIVIEQSSRAGSVTPTWRRGFNYVLIPVDDVVAAHQHAIGHGATHGLRPIRLADRCVFSWVRAPSGNWIEFVQYTDSGPLPEIPRVDGLWPEITAWREHGTPA